MDRLTHRRIKDGAVCPNCTQEDVDNRWAEILQEIANKLCDYEDAEEQGLLLRLPCKVGDTVYAVICGKWVAEGRLERYSYLGEGLSCIVNYEHFGTCQMFGWFNKDVFLTREEAEAALAKKNSCAK